MNASLWWLFGYFSGVASMAFSMWRIDKWLRDLRDRS